MATCWRHTRLGVLATLFIVLLVATVGAQPENATCVCSPRVYDITLDFSRTCNDNSGYGTGVQETRCNIAPFDDPSDPDLVPQQVTLIDVSELGQNLQSIVGSQRLTGNYENGDTITISSVSDNQDDLDVNNLPKAFQMSMIGVNAKGATIVFSALIVYSSSCNDYPVLLFGTSNGWALLTEQIGPHADLCPAADSSATPAPTTARTLPPISETTVIPTVAPIAAETPTTVTPSSVAPAVSDRPVAEISVPSAAPVTAEIPSETTPVPGSPTPMPVVSRTIEPTATTTTAPTPLAQTNKPTTTRAPLSTMTPVKELTATPTTKPGKKKETVCSHIKESKSSNKVSKSKGGKGSAPKKGGKGSAPSKSGKDSAPSKSGKGSEPTKSSESFDNETSSETGKGGRSGKKGKKKRNKRKKKNKQKSGNNIWSRNGRFLNEMEKRNAYFQVHDDVFQERVANFSTNATIPGAVEEAVYVAIYKEVFQDVECYEIDVDEPDELAPAFSPLTSGEEPSASDPPVSISPMISPSPTTPLSIVPSVVLTAPSTSPTNATKNESLFDDLVLDRANMTGPVDDRSSAVNSTRTEASAVAEANKRRRTVMINAWVILSTFLGGSLLMSVLLIRYYGPQKPMWHIFIPSTSGIEEEGEEEEYSVESRLTDDKRMGV